MHYEIQVRLGVKNVHTKFGLTKLWSKSGEVGTAVQCTVKIDLDNKVYSKHFNSTLVFEWFHFLEQKSGLYNVHRDHAIHNAYCLTLTRKEIWRQATKQAQVWIKVILFQTTINGQLLQVGHHSGKGATKGSANGVWATQITPRKSKHS